MYVGIAGYRSYDHSRLKGENVLGCSESMNLRDIIKTNDKKK